MHSPYQCLAECTPKATRFLLAASGPQLFSISIEDGSIVGSWGKEELVAPEIDDDGQGEINSGPPTKKRRLSHAGHEDLPNISIITVTHAQTHAVVVTAEDKCIRVFGIAGDGQLQQLSARSMPKRPSAIALTPNDTEILSADKFGDVYSIPLIPTPEQEEAFATSQRAAFVAAMAYAPTASDRTVHSKANKKALENQLQRAKEKSAVKTKEPLIFSHKLLLGHVSMLTDLLCTTLGRREGFEQPRSYILTADRDEHIRVSRGLPQAFVIEGYCLGHREFVNRLCLAEPTLLVSGGGDDDLLVWEWLEQKLINRVNISKAVARAFIHIDELLPRSDPEAVRQYNVAVSGLWRFSVSSIGRKPHLLFTCEGVPAVFHFPISAITHEKGGNDIGFIPLHGNPLAIASIDNTIIVSIDNIHKAGSTTEIDEGEDYKPRTLAFELVGEDLDGGAVWKSHVHLNHILTYMNERNTVDWHEKKLQHLLYGVEALRKRGNEDSEAMAN